MNWRQQALDFGDAVGRAVHQHALGVGVEFDDGYDAFWILPGEVTSTIPISIDGPAQFEDLVAEYHRINDVRLRVLHVIRHYFSDISVKTYRHRSGVWEIEIDRMRSSMSVGAYLTAIARDVDIYEAVSSLLGQTIIREAPNRAQIDHYLATPPPPSTDDTDGDAPPADPALRQTIESAVSRMSSSGALDETNTSSETAPARPQPAGRIGQMFLQLAARLPDVKAVPDLLRSGTLSIPFEDAYDGWFEINAQSRELTKRVAADGPAVVSEQLAAEFRQLNAARGTVFNAIHRAAADRGWKKQEIRIPLFGIEHTVYLGDTFREVTFEPDALTDLLRNSTPEAAIRGMFESNPDFAEACVAALNGVGSDAASIKLPHAALAPRDVPPAPPLRELDSQVIAEMDRFADQALRHFMRDANVLAVYHDRNVFDPAIDSWTAIKSWAAIAKREVATETPNWPAILVLLDAGDPRGAQLVTQFIADAVVHDDASDAEVEIVWRHRHKFPQKAHEWFDPQPQDDIPFARQRAELGDPIAIRRQTIAAGETDALPTHDDLLLWAKSDHRWSPPLVEKLKVALRMGWQDVADAIETNPYALSGLLTIDRRGDQFDEPGFLLARDFLLVWSRLSPTPFLAKLIATAHKTELVALAEEAARRSAVGKPNVKRNLTQSAETYRQFLRDLRPAMAIAWKRCRQSGAPQI